MTTFEVFISNINKFYKDNPELKKLQVITAGDDEGNSFNPVIYPPSKGLFEEGEFTNQEEDDDEVNAVCLN